jgi:asparagine synthetase B (glutamine-hydrolysing)
MCSFLMTNVAGFDVDRANAFQRRRGPDLTKVVKLNGITFVHNLLSITGAFSPQPFGDDGIAVVFNGQIYNYADFGEFDSDGKCLLPTYEAAGPSFVRDLDGEFAIAVVDWRRDLITVSTDIFGTKPLHYSIDGHCFGIATYKSALEAIGFRLIDKVPPNRCLTINLKTLELSGSFSVCDFSLGQHKRHFDDWIIAFRNSIKKRTHNCREKIFIGLSSGYDSGAISCELNRQGIQFKSYSIVHNERHDIIDKRVSLHQPGSDYAVLWPSAQEKEDAKNFLEANVELMRYNIFSKRSKHTETHRLQDDSGANGLSIICRRASEDGRRIYLSGQGADEIFADYGFAGTPFYPHSNFGGQFPEDLKTIFPWPSFYGSTQSSYLMKEEYVAGGYGLEARYPYLDRMVAQEFLSLSHHLKNWRYKSVLRKYLDDAGYPCAFDEKFGFIP